MQGDWTNRGVNHSSFGDHNSGVQAVQTSNLLSDVGLFQEVSGTASILQMDLPGTLTGEK